MSTGDSLSARTDQAVQRLGSVMLRDHTMDTLLQAVVDMTRWTLPGPLDASISVLVGSRPATAAHTGQLSLDLDETQYARGHGPCLHAAVSGEEVQVDDARTDTRWADHMARAVASGCLSSLSVPLPMDGLRGGLNIYAREAGFFDDAIRWNAGKFARAASVAINNMHAYQSACEMADNLEAALGSRAVIDQAKGILMERHQLTPDQAFHFLAHAAQAANVRLRDVAEHMVRTGDVLQPRGHR